MIKKKNAKVYIIGAGFAGQMIASDIKRKKIFGNIAAFLDDDKDLIGKDIDGIRILGPIKDVAPIIRSTGDDEAVIAIPSAGVEKIKSIYEVLVNSGFKNIKILPSISQVVNGTAHFVQAREIDPLDILGRTPVTISLKESLAYLRGKRVLITGAGGSIGSELARQLLSGGAERLYLFGHGENSIYQINRELKLLQQEGVGEKATVVPIIGDMKEREYVRYIISHTKCDVIFHCAAYKHVPLMEENPVAVIENNVFGTKNLLDASIEFNVKKFVLISTDKAVSPVSVYGASKFLCEKLLLEASEKVKDSHQDFMFVRFGNVLGSRGSILPLFMEQIKNGGPVTVTDPRMERFFMTIPEACSLVLQTGGVGKNGFSYLLDMGEPIKIKDLAEHIISFSGLEPYKDIEIQFTGARKGERLTEPLWLEEENPQKTEFPKILKLHSVPLNFNLEKLLNELQEICISSENTDFFKYRNAELLRETLQQVIPELKNSEVML
ncbi:MAG: nucleoside-diphosphate sugar epimerase/dehydratase [Treponema sp.]|nr:nucleoside-diphosphate sugar epimerase/dehydratase [Treponema sp.]